MAPDPVIPDALRRVGKVHHVALIVTSIEASLGLWRDALGLELETVMDIPDDRVRIAFLGVGESKVELVQPTDDTTGVARFLAEQGRGLPPRLPRGPEPRRDAAPPRDRRPRADRFGPTARRRGTGRLPPPALVPRRARRADRGAGRAGLGLARASEAADRRRAAIGRWPGALVRPASSPSARTSAAAHQPCPAAGGTCRPRPRPGSRPSSPGTGARRGL